MTDVPDCGIVWTIDPTTAAVTSAVAVTAAAVSR